MVGFQTSLVACALFLSSVHATFSGRATFFTPPATAGVCGVVYTSSDPIVALNTNQFTLADCGKTVTITSNGKSAAGIIQDSCVACGTNNLDLTTSLFEEFAPLDEGLISVTWDFA